MEFPNGVFIIEGRPSYSRNVIISATKAHQLISQGCKFFLVHVEESDKRRKQKLWRRSM